MKTFLTFIFSVIISVSIYSQSSYTWVGTVNNSFSTAANWSPLRTIGLTSDKLIFETGTTVNIINVNLVTIGQLIIRNNTNLSLSPSSGNSKTIFINGSTGDDLVIEQGSCLTISGNDPQLNIQIKAGATAVIFGQLIFSGEINHTISSIETLAIKFKQGSVLKQLCPGNIFTTTGVINSVVFESGSEIRINHANALSPFGLSAPGAKVKFEKGSNFVLSCDNAAALSLSGRQYSNLVIDNNTNPVVAENMVSPVTIGNLTINNNASIAVKNINTNSTSQINIEGNLMVNGYLNLSDTAAGLRKLDLNFNGSEVQTISGNGTTSFSGLNKVIFTSSVNLLRDLVIESSLVAYGHVTRNSYNLVVNGKLADFSTGIDGHEKTGTGSSQTDNNNTNSNSPKGFAISQNYPNPFNPGTKIDYVIAADSKVSLTVFDITGKKVATLVDENQSAGSYTVQLNASNLSSGIYIYKITADGNGNNWSKTQKMILAK